MRVLRHFLKFSKSGFLLFCVRFYGIVVQLDDSNKSNQSHSFKDFLQLVTCVAFPTLLSQNDVRLLIVRHREEDDVETEHDPLNIKDETYGRHKVEPEKETVAKVRKNDRIQEQFERKHEETKGERSVEVKISFFCGKPES